MKKLPLLLAILLCLTLLTPACAQDVPYLQKVRRADEMIFSGPGYDEFCVGTVKVVGTFTIVEEATDGEGHLWGWLKSGAGWIDLTHVRDEDIAAWPVSAAFAEDCPPQGEHTAHCVEESDYTTWIAFRAYAPLTEVALLQLDVATDEESIPARVLATWPTLTPDAPLLVGVVFYGDMTTYALQCTDEAGQVHLFPVTISGRNGMLLLDHWLP